jgi:hypothetical protein
MFQSWLFITYICGLEGMTHETKAQFITEQPQCSREFPHVQMLHSKKVPPKKQSYLDTAYLGGYLRW